MSASSVNETMDLLDKVIFGFESGLTINPVVPDSKRSTDNAFEIVHINEFTQEKIKG